MIGTNLDRATLTDACLWGSQRAEWSIHNVICEAIYWDKNKEERTVYQLGEFERLYGTHTKIVLQYEGGISPIEIATLPALIQQLEATHPGCALRLEAIQAAAGGATVTLIIENIGSRTPAEQEILRKEIEMASQQAVLHLRTALEERAKREAIELELAIIHKVYEKTISQVMEHAMKKTITNNYNASIYGNPVGEISGTNATVSYTYNDPVALKELVREMTTLSANLSFSAQQREQFEMQLNILKEQVNAPTPNHSLLREALHSVRHILEAGVAHGLVGPGLHELQHLVTHWLR